MAERYKKLEEKHNKLMAELKSKVECPVCLTIPREGPMASCPKGHLVCVPCHQTMVASGQVACPNCREPMGKNRSLLAKTVIENIEHECSNEGCGKKIGHKDVSKHAEEFCQFRKVLCPGNSTDCNSVLAFSELNDHIKICTGIVVDMIDSTFRLFNCSINKGFLAEDQLGFKTLVVRMNNEVFALQQKMENSNINFSVLMLAPREKCDRFKITLELQNNNSKTAFSAQFNPSPVEMEASDEAIFML